MKKNRMYAVLAACIVSALLFTACAKKTETKDNKVVNLWATGSDNVRPIFDARCHRRHTRKTLKSAPRRGARLASRPKHAGYCVPLFRLFPESVGAPLRAPAL